MPDRSNLGMAPRLALTALVIVLMVPGLFIEPGPISEIVGLGALGAIWGLDLTPGDGGGGT